MLMTGLSGNEIYCLAQKGFDPGNIVVGNSVQSLGLVRGFTSGLKTMTGGEIRSITELIVDGRHAAINRLEKEASDEGDRGLTGVVSDLRKLGTLMEFIAIGSSVKTPAQSGPFFSTACSGQDLYCQVDSGYEPRHFVIGNVAYALGIARDIGRAQDPARRGEVKEFSDMYNHTRHLALLSVSKARGGRARVQRGGRHHHPDHPVRARGPRDADGRDGFVQPGPGLAQGAVHLEADGRVSFRTSPSSDTPRTPPVARDERLRPGLRRRVHGVLPLIRHWGEIDEATRLVYDARENCLDHIRREADRARAWTP